MNAWMHVTGWTLIHFVWQGALLALSTAAALRLIRLRSPEARYAIACAGLTAMLATPLVTAAFLWTSESVARPADGVNGPDALRSEDSATTPRLATGAMPSPANSAAGTRIRLETWLSYVVWAWLAGVTLLMARFVGGCWRVHRLRLASRAESLSPWQSASERLAARLRLDAAFRVVESALVDAPSTIGWIRPVILLPVAALANLAPVQIEAILAHELAHIRRRDYVVNLLQTVAEALLFYHPGIWWVSARVREEREHCCDDVAVEMCGEPAAYASALTELAAWRTGDTALAVGATDGSLLARVRRLLRVQQDDEPRSIGGVIVLAVGTALSAALVIQSSFPVANARVAARAAQTPAEGRRVHNTDHFEIHYRPDLDLHAERVGVEAERAYAHVSSDLKHNLAFRVPVVLFHTTQELEQDVQANRLGQPHAGSVADPSRDRILLAMDYPADEWSGRITHEVAHVFGFDILPGAARPQWIAEGLAEYERGTWDPSDLVVLREAVRASAIPKMSGLRGAISASETRMDHVLGHAVFDFIESRWGKPGVRQFIFRLRLAAANGGDPYEAALQLKGDEFDRAFEAYLLKRFAAEPDPALPGRFDDRASLRIEAEIIAVHWPVPAGRACLELWGRGDRKIGQRWAVECDGGADAALMRHLRPGDRVVVTGPSARSPASQRVLLQSLERGSDGFSWRARAE